MSAPPPTAGPAARLAGIFGVKTRELHAVGWSFAYFFCLLSAYYTLRPMREAMAIVGGTQNIPWLFTGTFVATLLATPVFGWVASRFPRKTFLPWVYYFFIGNILLFYVGFLQLEDGGGAPLTWLSRAFFVWLSVFNLFVVSVFWSFMADIYSKEQGRRLFGVISAGGSTGAIAGPWLTSQVVESIGTRNLLLISVVLLTVAVVCVFRLRQWATQRHHTGNGNYFDSSKPIGGKALDGIRLVFRSPYLASIAAALLITNFLGVAIYMYMAELVDATFADTDEHTRVFAYLDAATNALAFIGQLFLVRYSVRKLGVGGTLAIFPLVSIIGFALLALHPVFVIMAGLQVARRSIGFGLTKPTSDMLYSVVSPDERYKAKNFVETAIYRGSDLVASWTIRAVSWIGISGIAVVCMTLSVGWILLVLRIGREYLRRDEAINRGETV